MNVVSSNNDDNHTKIGKPFFLYFDSSNAFEKVEIALASETNKESLEDYTLEPFPYCDFENVFISKTGDPNLNSESVSENVNRPLWEIILIAFGSIILIVILIICCFCKCCCFRSCSCHFFCCKYKIHKNTNSSTSYFSSSSSSQSTKSLGNFQTLYLAPEQFSAPTSFPSVYDQIFPIYPDLDISVYYHLASDDQYNSPYVPDSNHPNYPLNMVVVN
jgi:hypothetical protein